MFSLYPYQHQACADIDTAFEQHDAVVLCMPTGSGKTVTFASFIHSAMQRGLRCMVLCHRSELIRQAVGKLNELGLFPVIIDPKYTHRAAPLYVASVDTLKRRQFPDIDLLIVDEAHIRAFDLIVMHYIKQGAKVIAATATPTRKGKKFLDFDKIPDKYNISAIQAESYTGHMGNIYKQIIEPITIGELLKSGNLCPPLHIGPKVDVDFSALKSAGEDFTEKSLAEAFGKSKLYGDTIELYNNHTPNTKALVFNVNVEISKKMTAEFMAAGIKAAHLDSDVHPDNRKKILADYERGEFAVLNNVGVATTGTDIPSIETVIVRRATDSLSLWLQMCGRGGRTFNGRTLSSNPKDVFYIVDMGGNIERHGAWHWEREWSLDVNYVSKKAQAPIVVFCESCSALIPPTVSVCPYCQAQQAKREAARQAQEEKAAAATFGIIDVDQQTKKPLDKMSVQELERYREAKGYKLGWMVHQLMPRGEAALTEYATYKGYSMGWVRLQLSNAEEARKKAVAGVASFKNMNPHISADQLEEYARKDLKRTHSAAEIDNLIPIITGAKDAAVDRTKIEW